MQATVNRTYNISPRKVFCGTKVEKTHVKEGRL